MSAETLREAARLMRERAEAADDGIGAERWYSNLGGYVELDDFLEGAHFNMVADAGDTKFADHIASWHPAVAVAVAESLTAHVESHEENDCEWTDLFVAGGECAALAVARAYLGDPS